VKKDYAGLLRFLGAAVLIGGGALLALGFLEEKFAFYPSRAIEMTPDALGLRHEEVRLDTADGQRIAGWWLPAAEPLATVLFLHGNAGNISHRLHHLMLLHGADLSVLIIDYRGYGESSGSPSEEGLYLDTDAAWKHLTGTKGIDPGRIVLYGESIGCVPALHLARKIRRAGRPHPGALVLEGVFTSALEMGRRVFPFLPIRLILSMKMDNLSAVAEVDAPTLFLHGSDDEIVPIRMARRVFDASPARLKEFYEVPGGMHNTVWMIAGTEITDAIRAFLVRALDRS
jgi:fermentation-respiration switch protein FrsA (DUF1100 family)